MASSTTAEEEQNGSSTLEMYSIPKFGNSKGALEEKKEDRERQDTSDPENVRDDVSPPETAWNAKEQWNQPRINVYRVFATFFSFLTVGMNDGSYGVSPMSQPLET